MTNRLRKKIIIRKGMGSHVSDFSPTRFTFDMLARSLTGAVERLLVSSAFRDLTSSETLLVTGLRLTFTSSVAARLVRIEPIALGSSAARGSMGNGGELGGDAVLLPLLEAHVRGQTPATPFPHAVMGSSFSRNMGGALALFNERRSVCGF